MPGIASLLGFAAAALVILLIPGPGVLLAHDASPDVDVATPRSLYRLFVDGVVVSVLNPKIALFFLAFLPQFVEPARGPVPLQILFLGLLYVALALVTDSTYSFLSSRLRGWLRGRVIRGPLPRYASGFVYLGLGVSTAFADRR